jgi:hypothetical protein
MDIDSMIAVLQAAKAGKQIEYIWKKANDGKWCPSNDAWNFHEYDYRVKPEPREWTVWISPDGNIYNQWSSTNWPQILVREVLE